MHRLKTGKPTVIWWRATGRPVYMDTGSEINSKQLITTGGRREKESRCQKTPNVWHKTANNQTATDTKELETGKLNITRVVIKSKPEPETKPWNYDTWYQTWKNSLSLFKAHKSRQRGRLLGSNKGEAGITHKKYVLTCANPALLDKVTLLIKRPHWCVSSGEHQWGWTFSLLMNYLN